jgi:hypothetical protein
VRPQVPLVDAAVVAELLGAVVMPGVVVVVEPPPLLLLHALPTRAIPASMATAATRRMWGMTIPSSVSDFTLVGYHPVGLWYA